MRYRGWHPPTARHRTCLDTRGRVSAREDADVAPLRVRWRVSHRMAPLDDGGPDGLIEPVTGAQLTRTCSGIDGDELETPRSPLRRPGRDASPDRRGRLPGLDLGVGLLHHRLGAPEQAGRSGVVVLANDRRARAPWRVRSPCSSSTSISAAPAGRSKNRSRVVGPGCDSIRGTHNGWEGRWTFHRWQVYATGQTHR